MKIAFDHQIFGRQKYGGISRYYTKLAQGLLDIGNQVEIFAPLYQNTYLAELPFGIVHGRQINGYPYKMARVITAYNHALSKFYISRWKPEIIHETYYSSLKIASRECRSVITVHDMIDELFPDKSFSGRSAIADKRSAIHRAEHVICVSHNTKIDLMRIYDISEKKISVVHHGIEKYTSNIEIDTFDITTRKPFLLYIGKRNDYKNFASLVRAVASSRRLSSDFNIVAFGGGSFSVSEFNLLKSLGVSERQVLQVGGDDRVLSSLFKAARAFIYPSLYEGFGIPPLEAMSYSCPVISSHTSSMPEVIENAAEYFDPSDIEDMRTAIENVVYSESRIDELIRRGEKRLTYFSWEKCAKETCKVYQSFNV